jgi:hypothetical protein
VRRQPERSFSCLEFHRQIRADMNHPDASRDSDFLSEHRKMRRRRVACSRHPTRERETFSHGLVELCATLASPTHEMAIAIRTAVTPKPLLAPSFVRRNIVYCNAIRETYMLHRSMLAGRGPGFIEKAIEG